MFSELWAEIFCLWTSILISWSFVVSFCLFLTINKIKKYNHSVRQSDKNAILISILGGIFLTLLLFVFPSWTYYILDTFLLVVFWYTTLLGAITSSSFLGSVKILFSKEIRSN